MKRRTLIVAVQAAVAVASCGGGGGGDVASVGSGGTGISGEGVGSGGTGIFASSAVGSISGFSSVIVNGVREVIRGKSWRLIAALQQNDVVDVILMLDASTDLVNKLNSPRWTIG